MLYKRGFFVTFSVDIINDNLAGEAVIERDFVGGGGGGQRTGVSRGQSLLVLKMYSFKEH